MFKRSSTAGLLLSVALTAFNGSLQGQSTNDAQTAPKHHKAGHRKPARPSLEEQIQSMRDQLQAQIDDLKAKLAEKDAALASMQASSQAAQAATSSTAVQLQTLDSHVQQDEVKVNTLSSSVSAVQNQAAAMSADAEQTRKTQEKMQHAMDEPTSLRYKGITITPGGFLAGESVYRQRAINADIYTPWNLTPYMNSDQAYTSEWVPTARQSRLSTLFSGKVPFGTISGYFEGDFLSAGSTSNNIQSNSYTLRVRQAWAQAATTNLKFTAGQMYTLMTEDQKSTNPGQEALPMTIDNNFTVGMTWLRQPGFRLQDSITPLVTVAASIENSQTLLNASNPPTNFFFGNAGAPAGLNNPLANYTSQVSPDVVAKVTFDPRYGHFEVGGIARFFRDRVYPTATSAQAQNDTTIGGGFLANARFTMMQNKAVVGLHLVAGDGTGRYGASLLPDVTVRPDGTLVGLHNAQALLSLEAHPKKKLDLYGYLGTEYVQRTTYMNAKGVLVGYAPISGSNADCSVQPITKAGTGFAPEASPCLGATRDLVQGTVGWWYRLYAGPAGRLQYGLAYSYLTKEAWSGVGGAPKANNNLIYTSVRYFIP